MNISALDARNNALAVLESWSDIVAEERGAVAPARSVPQLARFLAHHLDWLAAQPPAADFADEVEGLHVELLQAIDPDTDARRPLTTECVVDGCTGTIDASPRKPGGAGRSRIGCSSGHSWEMHEWLALRRLMDRKRKDAA